MSTLGPLQSRSGALELQATGAERGRLVLQNLNGFTEEKAEELKHFVESSRSVCLILCLTELNVDWRSSYKSLKEMTRWRCNRHVMMAHNTRERKDRLYQPGGVAVLSVGEAAARVIGTEMDPSGLGRWCGVCYQLKAQKLWVIVVYRPCVAQGQDTVYQQHLRYLRSVNDERDPRVAVLQDVAGLVARLREQGNWVILSGDFNEDVRSVRIPGIREAITRYRCGPTHQRGSVPIDGFFTSITLPVTGGGISSSYAVTTSDHYAVWLDTPVFSKTAAKPLQIRKLNVHDPRCEEKYLHYLRVHLTPELDDEQRTAVMVQAENQCRRLFTGGLDYSPELSKAILWVRLWKLRHKRAIGNNVDVSVLIRLEKKVDAEDGLTAPGLSTTETKEGLLQARLALKSVRQRHQALRFQHLSNLAAAGSVGINELIERERSRSVFRRIREAIPSKTKRPLFMVRDHDGMWQDTEESIFYAVVDENRKRFTQTNDTPLRVEPLRSILGDLGETEAVDNVLSGTFDRLDVNPAFVDLLPFLRLPNGVEPLNIFTDEDYRKGWRKMDPNTGCQGPLHFGHFKAVSKDDELRGQAVEFLRSTFSSGIPADRWLQGTDVMIEKQPGEYRVEKLRTILLMQPDFNFGNKMIGRAMMEQAERLELIPESQYGSRRAKSASLQVCNKVLMFELCRMQLIPVGYCSTDAKSNYDRIIHSFAVMAMRRFGVPKEVALCMFRTLQQMRHQVRTGFGVSENSYTATSQDPFQGVGQGNGAGPAIWAAVSAPLLAWLDSRDKGVVLKSAVSDHVTKISSLAFVDDTDVVFSPSVQGLHEDLRDGMQDQLQAWERVLRVTGGAIVPEKSFYWSMYFVGDKVQTRSNLPPLVVTDCHGAPGDVPHLLPTESRRTLGLMINPLGDWKSHKNKLRQMMVDWAEACKVSGLTRQDALIELKARVLPRILYGLEATSFTRADCRYIMAPMLKVGLQSSGIASTMPRPIVFGPEELLGLDLTDIYVAQGVRHLSLLEFHGPLTQGGLTSNLIRALLEEALVHTGLPGSIFTQNFDDYGSLLQHGWVKTLWRFCWDYKIELCDWLPHIPLLRENDRFLMIEARAVIPQHDSSSLTSFNKCRRYLRVVTMADIGSGNGTRIREDAFNGIRNNGCQRPFSFTESHPSSADWKVWKGVLRSILGPGTTLLLPLTRQLGRWYSTVEWKCYMTVSEDAIYLKKPIGWSKHLLISRSSRQRRYALVGHAVEDLPVGALFRGIIEQHSNGFISSGAMGEVVNPLAGALNLPEIYAERFGSGSVPPVNGTLTICSDGSYKNGRGTASWIAVAAGDSEMGEDLVVPDGVHNSYRSELAGILGGLRFLDSLQQHQLPSEARFLCDGKSALEASFRLSPLQMSMDQLDLLQGIRKCRDSLGKKGVSIRPIHVKGHADEAGGMAALTEDEILNIRMDSRAKAFWQKMDDAGWPRVGAPKLNDSCSVRFAQTHTPGPKLHRAISEQELRHYWLESKNIKTAVDWHSLAVATRAVRRGKGVFLTKFFSGICGVNKWRKRWGMSDTDQCPRCGLALETTSHLWFCTAVEAQSLREKAIDDILEWLRSQGGNTRFCRAIRSTLGAIRNQGDLPMAMIPEEYWEAFAAQTAIGWDNFLKGCWALEWKERLRGEYEARNDRRQPERMVAAIIERLFETSWDLWLGRNAAVYPNQELSAEGEAVPVDIRPTRLCRRKRRSTANRGGQACMSRWLSGGSSSGPGA